MPDYYPTPWSVHAGETGGSTYAEIGDASGDLAILRADRPANATDIATCQRAAACANALDGCADPTSAIPQALRALLTLASACGLQARMSDLKPSERDGWARLREGAYGAFLSLGGTLPGSESE